MRNWLKKNGDMITYLFFGVLTTAVSFLIYFPCYNWFHWGAGISNAVSWVISVAFAFLTNKPFVFKSHDWSGRVVWPELTRFVGCRIASGVLETGLLVLTVDWLAWNGNVMKLVTAVLVVILNYIGSKFLVFKNRK